MCVWQGTTMTDWEAATASTNSPSPCCWDINQALLLCKDFRMFWSMSTLGKWEVCPFVKLALRDNFTNNIQGLFRRKLELYMICTKVLDSIKNDQWLTEFPFLCFTVFLYLVQKVLCKAILLIINPPPNRLLWSWGKLPRVLWSCALCSF